MGSNMVEFRIGLENQTRIFRVHEKLLCNKSLYFRKLLMPNGNSREGDKVYNYHEKLPGVDEFELVFSWIYTGNLHSFKFVPSLKPRTGVTWSWNIC